jgi:hypothetical protein
MKFGSDDQSESSAQPESGSRDSDCESALTPLPSDDEGEGEGEHKDLDIGEIKASIEQLNRYMAEMPVLELKEPQQDFVRPGVQGSKEKIGEYSYERTGVTHLVHAWHAQAHARPTVCIYSSP